MSSSPIRIDATARIAHGVQPGAGSHVDAGAVVPAGSAIGAGVRIGANAVLVAPEPGETGARIDDGARIGAAAVVHAGVVVAAGAVVMPGAVVTRSVPHGAIVRGNPAEIVGYVDATPDHTTAAAPVRAEFDGAVQNLPVEGVTLRRLKVVPDLRGNLTVGEFAHEIPFLPKRYFMVFGVPSREIRGEHAHRQCHQFLICVHGNCAVVADDGRRRAEVRLDRIDLGLHLPPMVWGTQYRYSPDAVLLVFASEHYDPQDYIRDYDDFLALRRAG